MPTQAYLDWNATAPLRPEAQAAVTAALAVTGNPSSVHAAGRAARRLVEDAREQVAALVGADAARCGLHLGRHRGQHAGAVAGARRDAAGVGDRASFGAERRAICRSRGHSGDGGRRRRSRGAASSLLAGRSRPLVSLMLANNETGVIQPVAEAAAIVHAAGGLLHVDAVQGAGPHRLRFQGARRRSDDAVVAQDRRAAGRRRADQARWACRSIR